MYKLLFTFERGTHPQFQDSVVHAASIDLFLRGIHTHQPNHHSLVFERECDVTYALLQLNDPLYTVTVA